MAAALSLPAIARKGTGWARGARPGDWRLVRAFCPNHFSHGFVTEAWSAVKTIRQLAPYAPAIIWGAFLLFLGGRSDVPAVDTDLPLDKAAHFVLYGILGGLTAAGWLRTGRRPAWPWLLVCIALVGAIDELNQSRVPTRSSDYKDWLADAAGAGVAFGWVVRRKRERISEA